MASSRDDAPLGVAGLPARASTVRSPVQWEARYRDRYDVVWRRCRLLDISMHGAGLLLVDDVVTPLRSVVLELRTLGRVYGIALNGEVRHSSVADGKRRIGVEFVDIGDAEARALREILVRRCKLDARPEHP